MDVESELGCEGGFVGWEAYPVALSFSPQPICSHQRNARLKEDSERLFVSNEDVCLEALRLGSWVRGARDVRLVKIKDTAGLAGFLRETVGQSSCSHVLYSFPEPVCCYQES